MILTHDETPSSRIAFAIGVWENEGGAPGRDSLDAHYGRRVEADRSWSVYHVFTGIPAHAGGRAMTGLSRADATNRMLSMNGQNQRRRMERNRLAVRGAAGPEIHAILS
jgi:hypothetical protein